MVAYLYPIEPNCRSKLCFVDPENGHPPCGGDFKRPTVPEPVAILPRHARVEDNGTLWKFSVRDPVLNHHPAIELIDLWKRWLRRVREARYWSLVVPDGRNLVRVSGIFYVPRPVQRNCCSLGCPQREWEGCRNEQDHDRLEKRTSLHAKTYQRLRVNHDFSISSSVLPLVSGTFRQTKRNAAIE